MTTATLPMHVKTGRWVNTPLEETLCRLCIDCCIEDEFHLLCVCRLYQNDSDLFMTLLVASGICYSKCPRKVYLMRYENREVANLSGKKLTTSVNSTYTNNS